MKGPAVLLSVLLVALAAAGCFGDDSPDASSPHEAAGTGDGADGGEDGAIPPMEEAPSPAWYLGDWWKYRVTPDNGAPYEMTAVAVLRGADAVLAAVEKEPGYEALFRHFPPLGTVTGPDLEVVVHGEPVRWFSFPLTDGKTWGSDYRGTPLTYTATRENVTVPGGTEEGFRVVANDGAADWFRFTYTNGVRWFVDLEFHRGGSEAPSILMNLVEYGTAYSGEYYDFDWAEYIHEPRNPVVDPDSPTAPNSETPSMSFVVEDGYSNLLIGAFLGGDAGTYRFSCVSQADPKTEWALSHENTQSGSSVVVFKTLVAPAMVGTWSCQWVVGGNGFVFGEVFAVKSAPLTLGA